MTSAEVRSKRAKEAGRSAPTLEFRSWRALGFPSRADIAEIEAAMLWPDDADSRARFLEAADFELCQESLQRAAGGSDQAVIDPAHMFTLMDLARTTPRLADMADDARKRTGYGTAAGAILLNYIQSPAPLYVLKDEASSKLNGALGGGFSRSTIENIVWKRFSPVAHLWAASNIIAQDREPIDRRPVCRVDDLSAFVVIAATLRRNATQMKPRQSDSRVLDNRTAWIVPWEISGLPALPATITWPRRTDCC